MTKSDVAFCCFDVESTGVDTENDRIVQLFIGLYDREGEVVTSHEWIIDPGVEMPEAASDVHGFTGDYLKRHGQTPIDALHEASYVFSENRDAVWVAFNLNFDLSILDAEFRRYSITSDFGQWANENVQLYDAIVVDRAKDKYRKGKRTLAALAGHYGVGFDENEAHNAVYDVTKTMQVTKAVIDKYGLYTNQEQSNMYREWAEHLQEYFRRTDPTAEVNAGWPLRDPATNG